MLKKNIKFEKTVKQNILHLINSRELELYALLNSVQSIIQFRWTLTYLSTEHMCQSVSAFTYRISTLEVEAVPQSCIPLVQSIFMRVCIYECMHVLVYGRMCVQVHKCVCMYVWQTDRQKCINFYIHALMQVCTHECVLGNMYILVFMYVCTHIICVYVRIHAYSPCVCRYACIYLCVYV
jgi:hypothetical protein